jgi:hypothetical protein
MTKNEQNRIVAWRLKLLREASVMPRNVAQACRHFGLSRNTFYIKWKARHRAHGEAGLLDRSRAPRRSPRATPREVVSKILYLRQTTFPWCVSREAAPGIAGVALPAHDRTRYAREHVELAQGSARLWRSRRAEPLRAAPAASCALIRATASYTSESKEARQPVCRASLQDGSVSTFLLRRTRSLLRHSTNPRRHRSRGRCRWRQPLQKERPCRSCWAPRRRQSCACYRAKAPPPDADH